MSRHQLLATLDAALTLQALNSIRNTSLPRSHRRPSDAHILSRKVRIDLPEKRWIQWLDESSFSEDELWVMVRAALTAYDRRVESHQQEPEAAFAAVVTALVVVSRGQPTQHDLEVASLLLVQLVQLLTMLPSHPRKAALPVLVPHLVAQLHHQ
eukprot:m.177175 g.177175  ORF g.177175 m.177175 type:complete len:154 (-) comp16812_c0_seq3:2753-3214(-)